MTIGLYSCISWTLEFSMADLDRVWGTTLWGNRERPKISGVMQFDLGQVFGMAVPGNCSGKRAVYGTQAL